MKIELVFSDWLDKNHNSIYNSVDGIMLSGTCFHSGTTFKAEIKLDAGDAAFLAEVLNAGDHSPVFYAIAGECQGKSNESEKEYKHYLYDLLAIIHRDGGHYTEKNGLEKSVNDAIELISKERAQSLNPVIRHRPGH